MERKYIKTKKRERDMARKLYCEGLDKPSGD